MKINFKILYIWYIAIVAVMLFSTCIKISNVAQGFIDGYSLAYENVAGKVGEDESFPMVWAGSNIRIVADSLQNFSFPIKLECVGDDACVELTPITYKVFASGNIGDKQKVTTLSAIQSLLAFSVLIISVAVFIFIVRLFIRMNVALKRKEIFDIGVIKTMKILGWLLLAQAVVNVIFMYVQTLLGECVLQGYNLDIVFFEGVNYTRFLLAFVAIIISEIFKIGHDIMEEQNLTI